LTIANSKKAKKADPVGCTLPAPSAFKLDDITKVIIGSTAGLRNHMTFLDATAGALDKFNRQKDKAKLAISTTGNVTITCLAGRMEGIFGLRASHEYILNNPAKFATLPGKEKAQ